MFCVRELIPLVSLTEMRSGAADIHPLTYHLDAQPSGFCIRAFTTRK